MGKLSNGVQKRKRDGKPRLVIHFRYRDKDGREQRYRKDARIQTRAGAEAEARRLREIAHTTGTLEVRPDAPTLRGFVDDRSSGPNFGRVLGSVTREFLARASRRAW